MRGYDVDKVENFIPPSLSIHHLKIYTNSKTSLFPSLRNRTGSVLYLFKTSSLMETTHKYQDREKKKKENFL